METGQTGNEPQATLLARWAFRTAIGTVVFFLLLGVFDGFNGEALGKAALFAAVLSAITHAEEEVRRRRSR